MFEFRLFGSSRAETLIFKSVSRGKIENLKHFILKNLHFLLNFKNLEKIAFQKSLNFLQHFPQRGLSLPSCYVISTKKLKSLSVCFCTLKKTRRGLIRPHFSGYRSGLVDFTRFCWLVEKFPEKMENRKAAVVDPVEAGQKIDKELVNHLASKVRFEKIENSWILAPSCYHSSYYLSRIGW